MRLSISRASSVVLAGFIGLTAGAARADIIDTCGTEIASYCSDVSEGRGRIAACLVGNGEKLGAGCESEVQALSQRSSGNILIPSWVRTMLVSRAPAQLPASCVADAARNCPDVVTGDSRVFACLYARNSRVSYACSTDAEQTMKRLN